MSVDLDDVGGGFIYGGIVIGLILLGLYFAFSKPEITECEKKGGVMVKSNGDSICVDKAALIPMKK